MYTHIGNGNILKTKDIIGVFDIRTIEASRNNKRICYELNRKYGEQKLYAKSVVLMQSKDDYTEEISQVAVSTLKKRLEKGFFNKREEN